MKIIPPLLLIFFGSFSYLSASLLKEVPPADSQELENGQTVITTKDIPGAPWPRLSLYRVVNAPPQVVADLFSDYSAAPSYIPGMLDAKVVATNADGTKDVRYTVKMPIIQKTSYVVRNTFVKAGQSYIVSWKLLKSPIAKSSDGSLRIEPYSDGRTLMCYTNLLIPITNLVAGLKNQALVEAKNTVLAIATEAERRANQLQH